jgi:hypothetical protein
MTGIYVTTNVLSTNNAIIIYNPLGEALVKVYERWQQRGIKWQLRQKLVTEKVGGLFRE